MVDRAAIDLAAIAEKGFVEPSGFAHIDDLGGKEVFPAQELGVEVKEMDLVEPNGSLRFGVFDHGRSGLLQLEPIIAQPAVAKFILMALPFDLFFIAGLKDIDPRFVTRIFNRVEQLALVKVVGEVAHALIFKLLADPFV